MAFVERDTELAEFSDLWASARLGKGRVAVIRGPVATGKTTLMHAAVERAVADGAEVFTAMASAAELSLPLGVVGQLLLAAPASAGSSQQLTALLTGDVTPLVIQDLATRLLSLSDRPFVIAVDDMSHCDPASLQCLLFLSRRLAGAPLLLVLAGADPTQAMPPFWGDLQRQVHCLTIRLRTLSVRGTEAMLGEHLPAAEARRLAASGYALGGGNAVLTAALIADLPSGGSPAGDLVAGATFAQAVADFLHRLDPSTRCVAQGLAICADAPSTSLLADLVGVRGIEVREALRTLADTGLVTAGALRHPAVRDAVLDATPPDRQTALHGRAAALLHQLGAASAEVADHLRNADGADHQWAVPVLREASEQALAAEGPQRALEYLRLADQICTDPAQQTDIKATLIRVEWQIDPTAALEHLPHLRAAQRAGRLTRRQSLVLVKHLLWFGWIDEAMDITDLLAATAGSTPYPRAILPNGDPQFLFTPYPELRRRVDGARPPVASLAAYAEQVLHQSPPSPTMLGPLAFAVATLAFSDRLVSAEAWCGRLLNEATVEKSTTWRALFTALLAQIYLRRGRLDLAGRYAYDSLDMLPVKGWGLAVGLPLAVVITSCVHRGELDEAARCLKWPVPEGMFRSYYGLVYLHARAGYHLATGRPEAALADLRTCGDLMVGWGCDSPVLVPWRSECAHVLAQLGKREEAWRSAQEQLTLLPPGRGRTRATSIRALAATVDPSQRPAMLHEAVRMLQSCGDNLELAATLTDLSLAHQALGEHIPARLMARRAYRLARQCGATELTQRLEPFATTPSEMSEASAEPDPDGVQDIAVLSDTERQVAALAALGFTNRKIADKLSVTVSTVEQHLTRVYRKLHVSSRDQLPLVLTVA